MQNADLTEKSGTLKSIKNLFSYIKMGKKRLGILKLKKTDFTTIRLLFF